MPPHATSALPAGNLLIDRVRRYYELVDQGDVPGLVSLFAPDATYHRPGYAPLIGHDDLTEFYSEQRVIREGRHSLSRIVAGELEVAVRGDFHGILNDGREVSLRFSDFFEFSVDGRFSRRDTYFFAPMV